MKLTPQHLQYSSPHGLLTRTMPNTEDYTQPIEFTHTNGTVGLRTHHTRTGTVKLAEYYTADGTLYERRTIITITPRNVKTTIERYAIPGLTLRQTHPHITNPRPKLMLPGAHPFQE